MEREGEKGERGGRERGEEGERGERREGGRGDEGGRERGGRGGRERGEVRGIYFKATLSRGEVMIRREGREVVTISSAARPVI